MTSVEKALAVEELPKTWMNRLRKKSSKGDAEALKSSLSKTNDPTSTNPESALIDPDAPSSGKLKAQRKSLRSVSFSGEVFVDGETEETQKSLPRRMLRRASLLLQETMDAATEAAEAYAAARDREVEPYVTPEERCMTYEMTGGGMYY